MECNKPAGETSVSFNKSGDGCATWAIWLTNLAWHIVNIQLLRPGGVLALSEKIIVCNESVYSGTSPGTNCNGLHDGMLLITIAAI